MFGVPYALVMVKPHITITRIDLLFGAFGCTLFLMHERGGVILIIKLKNVHQRFLFCCRFLSAQIKTVNKVNNDG